MGRKSNKKKQRYTATAVQGTTAISATSETPPSAGNATVPTSVPLPSSIPQSQSQSACAAPSVDGEAKTASSNATQGAKPKTTKPMSNDEQARRVRQIEEDYKKLGRYFPKCMLAELQLMGPIEEMMRKRLLNNIDRGVPYGEGEPAIPLGEVMNSALAGEKPYGNRKRGPDGGYTVPAGPPQDRYGPDGPEDPRKFWDGKHPDLKKYDPDLQFEDYPNIKEEDIMYELPRLIRDDFKNPFIVRREKAQKKFLCPCCDEPPEDKGLNLNFLHSHIAFNGNEIMEDMAERRRSMKNITKLQRMHFYPKKIRVTFHDERVCARLRTCDRYDHKFKIDPTRFFTDLKPKGDKFKAMIEDLGELAEPSIEFDLVRDTIVLCPCCDPPEDFRENFAHDVWACHILLSVEDAMKKRWEILTKTGGLSRAMDQKLMKTCHDDRICIGLRRCQKYRNPLPQPGMVDPTQYFTNKSLGRYEEAKKYTKKYGNEAMPKSKKTAATKSDVKTDTGLAEPLQKLSIDEVD